MFMTCQSGSRHLQCIVTPYSKPPHIEHTSFCLTSQSWRRLTAASSQKPGSNIISISGYWPHVTPPNSGTSLTTTCDSFAKARPSCLACRMVHPMGSGRCPFHLSSSYRSGRSTATPGAQTPTSNLSGRGTDLSPRLPKK